MPPKVKKSIRVSINVPPVPIVLTILSFLLQSGLCSSSELETSRGGHIRIQHLTAAASSTSTGNCSTIGLGRHGGHGGLSCTSGSASGLMASAVGCGAEAGEINQSRFPRLQSCAHFHYEFTDIGPISVIAPETFFLTRLGRTVGQMAKIRQKFD